MQRRRTSTSPAVLSTIFAWATLVSPGYAQWQTAGSGPTDPVELAGASYGIVPLDQTESGVAGPAFRAVGTTYKADFRRGGFQFTAALGDVASSPVRVRYELESIARGATEHLRVAHPSEPRAEAERIVYDHQGYIEEVYDIRRDHVEQSFILPVRPGGTGDLVVWGRFDSTVEMRLADDGAVAAELPGVGGIRIEGVVGIDAAGRRAAGGVRLENGRLGIALSADFVDSATYPLVVDPIIGVEVEVAMSSIFDPDVAFDAVAGEYFVVWQKRYSSTDADIHGRRIDQDGAVAGSLVVVESSDSLYGESPSVGGIRGADAYLVAWHVRLMGTGINSVLARAIPTLVDVNTATYAVTSVIGNTQNYRTDVGGNSIENDRRALLVWQSSAEGVLALEVEVNPDWTLTFDYNQRELVSGAFGVSQVGYPRITQSGGAVGRHMIVWHVFTTFGNDHDVVARCYDFDAIALTDKKAITNTFEEDERFPTVDGDGTTFLVAYEYVDEITEANKDVHAKRCEFVAGTPNLIDVGPTKKVFTHPEPDLDPAVALAPGKYFVAAARGADSAGLTRIEFAELAADNAEPCGPTESFSAVPLASRPALASRVSSDPTAFDPMSPADGGDELLCVWLLEPAVGSKLLFAQRLESFKSGGAVVNLGGGCGQAGTISTGGLAAIGYPEFSIELSGADPLAAAAILNLSLPGWGSTTCGACVINLVDYAFPLPVVGGEASISFPLPCNPNLTGKSMEAQYWVGLTLASPCSILDQVSFSDRLSISFDY